MHPVRKQRLILVCFIVVFSTLAVGLVTYGLRGNINLFFPPAEVAQGMAPFGQPIRVGGMVVDNSVQRSNDSLAVRFEKWCAFYCSCADEDASVILAACHDQQGVVFGQDSPPAAETGPQLDCS